MPNAVLQRLVTEREDALEAADHILGLCEDEERDPSQTERDLMTRHRTRAAELEPQIDELLEHEEARERGAAQRERITRAVGPTRTRERTDGRAPADADPDAQVYATYAQFARDVLLTRVERIGNQVPAELRERAAERLQRVSHTLSSDVPGLIPAQHLAQILEVIDRSRPLVEASRTVGLTSGKLTYPKVTGKPVAGIQAAEKTAGPDGPMTVAMEDVIADTVIASGNLSWQTINWSSPDALALWFDLAAESYAEQTESMAADALVAAAAGFAPGIEVASADLEGWMAAIAAAAGSIRDTSKSRANGVALDSTTGYALLGMVATANPVFLTVGGGNLGTADGSMGGIRFIVSSELPTPTAIVGDFTKFLTAETPGAPVEMRSVEATIGGMEVGIIGAFAAEVAVPGAFCELTPTPPPLP